MKRRLDEVSPKIKMSDIHDDRDDDIIELSDEELKEIFERKAPCAERRNASDT